MYLLKGAIHRLVTGKPLWHKRTHLIQQLPYKLLSKTSRKHLSIQSWYIKGEY